MIFKYLLILIFYMVYVLFDIDSLGFHDGSAWWTHLSYNFQHAGLVHLIINSIVFIAVFRVMEQLFKWYDLFLSIFIIAVIASVFSKSDIPTVGSSGMIYAMFGMQCAIVSFNSATIKQKAQFFVVIILMLVFSLFKKNSNFIVHLSALCLGGLYFLIREKGTMLLHMHPFRSKQKK